MKRGFIRLNVLLVLLVLLTLSSTEVLGQLAPGPVPVSPVETDGFTTHDITFVWQPDARQATTTVWYNLVYGVDGSGSFDQHWVSFGPAPITGNNSVTRTVLGNGTMVWSVRAFVDGVYTAFNSKNFYIDFVPKGLSTDAASPSSRGDVLYSWNFDTRATWYQLVVGIPASASASGLFETKVNEWYEVNGADNRLKCFAGDVCSVRPKTLPNGTYEWYVKAWGPLPRLSPFAGPQPFTISFAVPDAWAFVEDGFYAFATSTVADGDWPVFVFNDIPGASWYHLVVLRDGVSTIDKWFRRSTLTCNIEDGLNKCQVFPGSKSLTNGVYTWSVQAWGPGGMSAGGPLGNGWATATTLNMSNPSLAGVVPETISPKATTITDQNTAIFQWRAIQGATWWRLLIQQHNGTSWVTVFDQWRHFTNTGSCPGTVCSWANPTFLPNGTYRWWVNAWGPAGANIAWPIESSFSVAVP